MSKLAIIPARGGSKRIPRKNVKDFLGKPIIAYSIETALESGLFDEVMVSTEDDEIAEISKSFGAKVPFKRSMKNAGDSSGTVDVIKEVVANYKKTTDFDYICCLYPTAPFVKVKHLKKGIKLLIKNNYKTVFPVTEFNFPIWRSLVIRESKKVEMIWPEYMKTRSQDLKKTYHDAGQWYFANLKMFNDRLYTNNSGIIELSNSEVQDIDTFEDWRIAELKYKNLINSH